MNTLSNISSVNDTASFLLPSPLEQFEVALLFPFRFFGIDLSLTNSSLYMILGVVFTLLLFYMALTPHQRIIPTRWQYVAEQLYVFVLDMLKQQAGYKAIIYLPALLSIFLFILASNLLGLTPFGFTPTSHIVITFSFALAFNAGIFLLGLFLHNLKFFTLFVPSGVPKALLPLIVVIEVVSYVIRTFSLSLRLFANMDGRPHTVANFVFIRSFVYLRWWVYSYFRVYTHDASFRGYSS